MLSSTFSVRLKFKGTIVNQALLSLHGVLLEITLTLHDFSNYPKIKFNICIYNVILFLRIEIRIYFFKIA